MAGENPTCTIENHPDFSEPSEIKFTSLEQLIPTLREINALGLYTKRRKLEDELETIRFRQIVEHGEAENGVYHDVNSGLRGIALQAEICGLDAQITQLKQNTQSLLVKGKNIARKNTQEFELYKKYVLDAYPEVMKWRIVYAGRASLPQNDPFITNMVEYYIGYIDFFGVTEGELRGYISSENGIDELYKRIQVFEFNNLD